MNTMINVTILNDIYIFLFVVTAGIKMTQNTFSNKEQITYLDKTPNNLYLLPSALKIL